MSPVLQNISHIKFIITDVFQLDEIIKNYGKTFNDNETLIERRYQKITYSAPEYLTDISNLDKNLYSITELGKSFIVSKKDPEISEITKEEYENSERKNEDIFATLNYDEFSKKFDWDVAFTSFYWQILDDKYLPEFIESLKMELINAKTETACKIIYQELLLHIKESDTFLARFKNNELWQLGTNYSNEVQKIICSFFMKFNKSLSSEIKEYFKTIFPIDETTQIEENVNQIVLTKEDAEREKLRNSNIYKIGVLFADGTIYNSGIYQNGMSINKLTDIIVKDFGFSRNSLQPYLNDTLNKNNSDKNLFQLSKMKYLQLIADDFHSQSKTIFPAFSEKLQYLTSIIQED